METRTQRAERMKELPGARCSIAVSLDSVEKVGDNLLIYYSNAAEPVGIEAHISVYEDDWHLVQHPRPNESYRIANVHITINYTDHYNPINGVPTLENSCHVFCYMSANPQSGRWEVTQYENGATPFCWPTKRSWGVNPVFYLNLKSSFECYINNLAALRQNQPVPAERRPFAPYWPAVYGTPPKDQVSNRQRAIIAATVNKAPTYSPRQANALPGQGVDSPRRRGGRRSAVRRRSRRSLAPRRRKQQRVTRRKHTRRAGRQHATRRR
jgi:hypothetical protein